MSDPTCERCPRPVVDMAYVCSRCTGELRRDLERVAMLAGEAAVTIARLDRIGQGGRRTDTEAPLPVNLSAAADHDAAVTVLTTWARHVHESSGRPLPTVRTAPCTHASCDARRSGRALGPLCAGDPPEHPTAVVARWLTDQLDWLRHRQEASEAMDELADACRVLVRVVDRPPDRWYAGACDCGADLYPVSGATVVRCPGCGLVHDLAERKAWLLDQAEDVLAGAAWCAATVARLGVEVTASAVRGWAFRGRLASHGTDVMGHPLYRLGDVRELAQEQVRREMLRRHEATRKEPAA